MECSTRSRQDCAKPRLPREVDLTARAHGSDVSIGEFQLIERFFRRSAPGGPYVALGGGDDCALLAGAAGKHWAVSTDTLIEGVHFFPNVDPAALGHKSLAVGLSDLAACGATPQCFFLALALPRVDETWLAGFSRGLYALADAHQCVLAGGDTTRSPNAVVITITVMGSVPIGGALLRSGARVGDDVWVSGELGDAALGLAFRSGEIELPPSDAEQVVCRLEWPNPPVRLGERLVGVAMRHILRASAVGAVIEWACVPRSPVLQRQPMLIQQRCALTRGDDYEILFTAAASRRAEIIGVAAETVSVTRIGAITATADLAVLDEIGAPVETATGAYDHFGR